MSGGSITTVSVSNHSGGAHVEGWVVMNQNLSHTSLIPPQNCHYQLPGRSRDRKLHQQVFTGRGFPIIIAKFAVKTAFIITFIA